MVFDKTIGSVGALALGLMLAGCGDAGAGSGIAQIPAPTPTASYTKIADMTGDRTFQTGGVQYTTSATGSSNGTNLAFGNGVRVAYTAASDTYTLTAPDNTSMSFGPADAVLPPPNATTQQWVKINGTQRDQLTLIVPTTASGVPLSYTIIGTWGTTTVNSPNGTFRIAVGGAPTLASDMPKSGTANYTIGVGGAANNGGTPYTLTGNSSGSFSANFSTGAITTSLTLAGTQLPSGTAVTAFGTFNGTGSIATGGSGFTGSLSGTASNSASATGGFSGGFFGPQALEMGMAYTLTAGSFNAAGAATGVKQ